MNINETLLDGIASYLHKYDCDEEEIKNLLFNKDFPDRQPYAIDLIKNIMTRHGKAELYVHIAELAKIEHGIRQLEPWVRDHVVHAMLSFLLGIFIKENFLESSKPSISIFQWKLAGLFHDIGYPVQIASDLVKPMFEKVNAIKRALAVNAPDVYCQVIPCNLDKLTSGVRSLDLIQERLNNWGLKIDAKEEYERMQTTGKVCHGMISALFLLYVIDLMYKKYNPSRAYSDIFDPLNNSNWNQKNFITDVIDACSAIFIHNLPSRCFSDAKIDRHKSPVAFLLKLSDALQEWERPRKDNEGKAATLFDIAVKDKRLLFRTAVPEDKEKIEEEIDCLLSSDIDICVFNA